MPPLPDGLVVFVKRECPTCELVVPVLAELRAQAGLTVIVQDDPAFPPGLTARHDADLSLSWHHGIEAVPTLLRVVDGQEKERAVGWQRGEWEALTGVRGLGTGLPEWRPGCGSLSVDPDLLPELRVRFARIGSTRAASSWPSARTSRRRCTRAAGATGSRWCRRRRSACLPCSKERRARRMRSSLACRPTSRPARPRRSQPTR